MTELGSGIRLDNDFDFVPDDSGDIDAATGLKELGKDLALVVTEVLTTGSVEKLPDIYEDVQIPDTISPDFDPDTGRKVDAGGVVGSYFTEGLLRDVEVLVANLISIDPRIERVSRVEAQRMESDPDAIEVQARAVIAELTAEENFEFIIRPS